MGWTYIQTALKPEDLIRKEFGEKIVDIELVSGPEWVEAYISYRLNDGSLIAVVCLIDTKRPNMVGYKEMDETAMPCYHNCPMRILNTLTPLTDIKPPLGPRSLEWGNKWRNKCGETHQVS